MLKAALFLLPLWGLSPLSALPAQDSLANGDVREVRIERAPGTRVEHFRLDLPVSVEAGDNAAPARRPPPVGILRWISGPDTSVSADRGDAWRVECEVTFFEHDTRVVHTERIRAELRELVFREVRHRSGRTLRFRWTPDGRAESLEMIGGTLKRRAFDMSAGGALPLSLVEVVRRGDDWPERLSVFLPLSGDLETLRPVVSSEGSARVLELFATDDEGRRDVPAGNYRFEGDALVSFRWQDGGPIATAVDRAEYAHWRAVRAKIRDERDD